MRRQYSDASDPSMAIAVTKAVPVLFANTMPSMTQIYGK